jgi:hypothetical protein
LAEFPHNQTPINKAGNLLEERIEQPKALETHTQIAQEFVIAFS